MSNYSDRAAVIVRSVHERTEKLCCELILAQGVPEDHLFLIHESPFSAALRRAFTIGVETNLPWTYCVDADVLLRPGAIENMIEIAEQQKPEICEIQGYVLDKFFGGPREGGIHLYRTSLLRKTIEQVPDEGVNIRPEFHTLEAMRKLGFPYRQLPVLVGLHDFEQFYSDIYRKSFVQAHKHLRQTDLFLGVWRAGASMDPDYQVALKGFAAGVEHFSKVYIDINQEVFRPEEVFPFTEKSRSLTISEIGINQIENIITDWVEPDVYKEKYPDERGLIPVAKKRLSQAELQTKIAEIPGLKRIPYLIGSVLVMIGDRLQRWAKAGN